MPLSFKLPDIGEGVAEGEIVKWLVKEGDDVAEHQSVVEVMTDKATVEIPSPAPGRILALKAKPGDRVPVGSVLFELETAAGAPAPKAQAGPAAPKAPAAPPAAPAKAAPARAPGATVERGAGALAEAGEGAGRGGNGGAARGGAGAGGKRLEFKLPDIGEGVAEGEIVKWLVKPGAAVAEHQSVVEVMTDKATVEIPAPAAGKVLELKAEPGQRVAVGSTLFILETAAEVAAPRTPAPAVPTRAPSRAPVPALAGAAQARAPSSHAERGPNGAEERILAVPSARRVARELGVDLSQVEGSGRGGVVRRADVEAFFRARGEESAAPAAAPARPAAPAVALPAAPAETRVPFRGMRRKIAEAMVRSKFTAPHFTVVEELDVTDLVRVREQAKELAAESSIKLTYMPFIMKACALGLAKYPELNSKLDEAAQEIVTYGTVNLGIATDTPSGLIVPVIRDVQSKGLLQLAKELVDLADRTRGGKVAPEELKGSTFSITNAGNIGGTLATPIINFPDVGILGVHRIVKRPGVVETPQGDRIEVRQYMNLSLSVDHRLVDGATGVRFLVHLKRLLESPGLLAL